MPALFIHEGDYLDHTPDADLAAGAVVVLPDSIGIAVRAIPAGTLGSLAMTGVFEFPRAPGPAIPQGKRVFWDQASLSVSADAVVGGPAALGIAAAPALLADTTVRVRLNH